MNNKFNRLFLLTGTLSLSAVAQYAPNDPKDPRWNQEACQKAAPVWKKELGKCLEIKEANKREGCVAVLDKAPHINCMPVYRPLRDEYSNLERQRYYAGQNPGTPGVAPKPVSQKDCDAGGKKVQAHADGCLKMKDWNKRSECFAKVGTGLGIPEEVFQGCRQVLEPLKEQVKAKEKSLYPDQQSAVDGQGNGGGQQGGNQNGPGVPAKPVSQKDCDAGGKKVQAHADGCLKMKDWNKRSECFAKVGTGLGIPEEVFQGCRQVLEPLKEQVKAKEKSLYPDQQSAVDGQGNGGGQQGGNQQGSPSQGQGPKSTWAPEKCQAGIKNMRKTAETCVATAQADKRTACFEKMKRSYQGGFWDGCPQEINTLMSEMESQVRTKYPEAGQPGGQPTTQQNTWTESACYKPQARTHKMIMACANVSDAGKRDACIEKVKGSFQGGYWEGCQVYIGPSMEMFAGVVKAKYPNQTKPNQPSNGQQQGGQPNKPAVQVSQKECEAYAKGVRKQAESCLSQKDWNKRSECMANMGTKTGTPDHIFEGCRQVFDPLKSEIKGKEKSMYPDQKSAVDG